MVFNKNVLHREGYLKKKRKRKFAKYAVFVLLVSLIIGLGSYISHRSNIRISKVVLSGGVLVTEEDVSDETLSFIGNSYFWLFPKNNIFWYPRNALLNDLKTKFRRIDTINIHLKDFHTLAIDITERKPIGTWCSTSSVTSTVPENGSVPVEQCYFIDQNSTIFAKAPQFSGDAYFKYYGLITDDNPIGEEYIASTTEFSEVVSFVEAVKRLYVRPLYLVANGQDEFSLVVAGGGAIYFDTKEPLSKAAANFEALLETHELATSTSGNLPIDYIDLRYGNKLFYKLK